MLSTCTYKTIVNSGKEFKIGNDIDKDNLIELNEHLSRFESIFITNFTELSTTNAGTCSIKTKTNKPIVCQSNKLTRRQNEMLGEKMADLLHLGEYQLCDTNDGNSIFYLMDLILL